MNYFRVMLVFVLMFLVGCAHYRASLDTSEPALKPRILKGPVNEIQVVVYEAAKRAFPDEVSNIKVDDNKNISILREWFWRGDTLIKVEIEKRNVDEYIINAESNSSWHRLNGTALDVSKTEIADYFNALDQEYRLYLKNKHSDIVISSQEKTLANRLKELKQAFDSGLINENEYRTKRKEIIDEY